jgi:hypothetical protein
VALNVCTWWWGSKYTHFYVERLYAGLRRHLQQPFRFLLMTDRDFEGQNIECHPIEDPHLTKMKGCFARLRMFDPEWQRARGLIDRIVCLDLDVVITGPLDDLFDRSEPIVLFAGANSSNPCPYNNSIFMFRPRAHPQLWTTFSMDAVAKLKRYEFPDDQGWFWAKIPHAATWKVGSSSGIYAFRKPGWPIGDRLPDGAKIVAFPGHRDPAQFTHLPWLKEHWR